MYQHFPPASIANAFVSTPVLLPHSLSPKDQHRKYRQPQVIARSTNRIIFVPDRIHQQKPLLPSWFPWLNANIPSDFGKLEPIRSMPNPYDSNSKRWEAVWINAIREVVTDGTSVSLIGHGSGADACLRFLESHSIDGGAALISPTADEYYAGERHGRPYHWSSILDNVRTRRIALATSLVLASIEENETLTKSLRPGLNISLPKEKGRYLDQDSAEDIHKLVLWACTEHSKSIENQNVHRFN